MSDFRVHNVLDTLYSDTMVAPSSSSDDAASRRIITLRGANVTAGSGGSGGDILLRTGYGGNTTEALMNGGNAGDLSISLGTGGSATTGISGTGGSFSVFAGEGGAAGAGTSGDGGNIVVSAGDAGATAGTGANGGFIYVQAGTSVGAGVKGTTILNSEIVTYMDNTSQHDGAAGHADYTLTAADIRKGMIEVIDIDAGMNLIIPSYAILSTAFNPTLVSTNSFRFLVSNADDASAVTITTSTDTIPIVGTAAIAAGKVKFLDFVLGGTAATSACYVIG